MKKLLLSALLLLSGSLAYANMINTELRYFTETFTSDPDTPEGNFYGDWTVWGDGQKINSADEYAKFYKNDEPYVMLTMSTGEKGAFSNSSKVASGTANDWLISPQIEIKGGAATLSMDVYSLHPSTPFKYAIYVSKTGNKPEDFGTEPIETGSFRATSSQGQITNAKKTVHVSLGGFEKGEKIYFALVNQSKGASLNGFANISVEEYSIDTTDYTAQFKTEPTSVNVELAVKARTGVPTTGMTALLELGDGRTATWTTDKDMSTRYNTYSITFPDAVINLSKENPSCDYTVTITPGYEGATPTVIEGTSVFSEGFESVCVMEEGTGEHCGFCPRGMAAMAYYSDKYNKESERFIPIAVHCGPYSTGVMEDKVYGAGYLSIAGSYGFPSAIFGRRFDANTETYAIGDPTNEVLVDEILKERSKATVDVTKTEIYNDNRVRVYFKPQICYATKNANLTAVVVVREDDVHGTTAAWNQTNYYSGQPSNACGELLKPYLEKYTTAGQTISYKDMYYPHVGWGIFNSFNGEGQVLSDEWAAFTPQECSITFEMPHVLDNAGNKMYRVQDLNKTSVVVMILDKTTSQIYAAATMYADEYTKIDSSVENVAVANYSAKQVGDKLVVNAQAGVSVDVFDMWGTKLASHKLGAETAEIDGSRFNGIILVRMTNGNDTTVEKLMWK